MSTTENRIASLSAGRKFFLFGSLSLILLLCILTIAEVGVRTRMYFKYGSFFGFEVKAYDAKTGLRTPKPNYVTGPVKINSLGFRSPEIETPKPDNLLRLAFLGGSTTFCQEVSGNHMVWSDILTRELEASFPGQQFDHINASATGFTLSQSLTNLEKRVAPHNPDILFIYHAVNDIAKNGNILALEDGQKLSSGVQNPLLQKLLDTSLFAELIYKNVLILIKKNEAESTSKKIPFDKTIMANRFREDLTALVEEGLKTSELIVIPTFSNRLRKSQTPEQQLLAAETHLFHIPFFEIEDLLLAFDTYNDVIREFGARDDVVVIETVSVIEGIAENFVDSVHFTDAGSNRIGQLLASELSQNESFLQLVSQ